MRLAKPPAGFDSLPCRKVAQPLDLAGLAVISSSRDRLPPEFSSAPAHPFGQWCGHSGAEVTPKPAGAKLPCSEMYGPPVAGNLHATKLGREKKRADP